MTERTQRNLERLPRWARDEILQLRDSVDYWRQKIEVRDAGASGISFTCDHERHHPLPAGSLVTFTLHVPWHGDQLRPVEVTISGHDDGQALDVRAHDGGLSIEPMAANTIVVRGHNF